MSRRRKKIPLKTQLAAALGNQRDDKGELLIPYEHLKLMSPDQVISLFDLDHNILHAIEVIDEHWNLTFRLKPEHREKSKKDVGIIAKTKRLEKAHARIRAYYHGNVEELLKLVDNPPVWEKRKRKIRSKGFDKKVKRKLPTRKKAA